MSYMVGGAPTGKGSFALPTGILQLYCCKPRGFQFLMMKLDVVLVYRWQAVFRRGRELLIDKKCDDARRQRFKASTGLPVSEVTSYFEVYCSIRCR